MSWLRLLLVLDVYNALWGALPYVPSRPPGLIARLDGQAGELSVSPDGKHLASAYRVKVDVWDIETRRMLNLSNLDTGERLVKSWFRQDGKLIVLMERTRYEREVNKDRIGAMALTAYDVRKQKQTFLATAHTDRADIARMSADGRWLATGGIWDNNLVIWDLEREKVHKTLPMDLEINHIHFSLDARFLAVCSRAEVRILDTKDWKVCHQSKVRKGAAIDLTWFNSNTRFRLCWGAGRDYGVETIQVRKPAKGEPQEPTTLEEKVGGMARARSEKAGIMAVGVYGEPFWGNLILYDLASGRKLTAHRAHAEQVSGVAISPDGQRMFTTGGGEGIKIWSIPDLLKRGQSK